MSHFRFCGTTAAVRSCPRCPSQVPGESPATVVVDDFNQDQFDDIAILQVTPTSSNTTFGNVAVFINNGAGVLTYDSPSNLYPVMAQPNDMVVGDFNRTGSLTWPFRTPHQRQSRS